MTEALVFKVRKLLAQTNCPACGSTLHGKAGDAAFPTHRAVAQYECAAEFMVDHNGCIIASQPCWSASQVAARALNQEADQDAAKAGAA